MALTLYQDMFQVIDETLEVFISEQIVHLIDQIAPIFTSLVIIFCAIWGYRMMFGQVDMVLSEGFFKILRITFILTLGLTSSFYMDVIVSIAKGSGEWVASSLTGTPSNNIAVSLDQMMEKLFNVAHEAWSKAGILNGDFGMYIIAILIGFGGSVVITYLSFLILCSKVMTTAMLAIGPIFFVFLLFDSTKRWFENWLGYLVNAILILVLAVLLGHLCLHILEAFFEGIISHNPDTATLSSAILLTIVFLTVFMMLLQVPTLAAGLGGGISLATRDAISNTLHAMRPSTLQKQSRGVRRDFRIASSPIRSASKIFKK